jgi:hypothetical protein
MRILCRQDLRAGDGDKPPHKFLLLFRGRYIETEDRVASFRQFVTGLRQKLTDILCAHSFCQLGPTPLCSTQLGQQASFA